MEVARLGTGLVFVGFGLVVALAQTIALVRDLSGTPDRTTLGVPDVIATLVDRLPAAAVALAFTWFGGTILRWFAV